MNLFKDKEEGREVLILDSNTRSENQKYKE